MVDSMFSDQMCSVYFLPSDNDNKGYSKINILADTAVPQVCSNAANKRKPPTLRQVAQLKKVCCSLCRQIMSDINFINTIFLFQAKKQRILIY